MHTQTVPDARYRTALAESDPSSFNVPVAGSAEEGAMLGALEDLFTIYTYANLEANVTRVYAEQIYFRDAFKQLDSATAVRDYFLHGLEPVSGVRFVFNRVIRSGGEFYVDWTMAIDFKKTPPDTWEESMGVSHFRFNSEGLVIFHQDYWDPTDIVYKRIPLVKQLIAYVKRKL
ncbi:MAG: hypothetical protein GWO81_07155 [Verrucomicrobia bacterium]|nr:hypothetical protein [Verrucomicrobiota bacterium]